MVEFLTLFLWLTTGVQPVQLAVAGNVAAVVVSVDGEAVKVLRGEPWAFEYDFGTELRPRELVAVARDAAGRELDRATRWVNLGIGSVDARLELESDGQRRPTAVRLVWEGVGVREPEAVEITFDGQPLAVRDPRHVPLPSYDAESLHFLSAKVTFRGRPEIRLDASFGGVFGEEVASELTAVPVVLDNGRRRLPAPEEMEGWFVDAGAPLRVQTVEKAEADVVIVRDPAAQDYFTTMTLTVLQGAMSARRPVPRSRLRSLANRRVLGHAGLANAMRFPKNTGTRFVSAFAVPILSEEVTSDTFLGTESYSAQHGGVLFLARSVRPASPPLQLADAVALAGMEAGASGHRRAVILVLASEAEDRSQQTVANVREYLRLLRVPLYVWSMTSETPHPEWGEVTWVGYPPGKAGTSRLSRAVKAVGRDLGTQRIVWIRGRHLPQAIELGPRAEGLRLAGQRPAGHQVADERSAEGAP